MNREVLLIGLVFFMTLLPVQVQADDETGMGGHVWGGGALGTGLFKFTGDGVTTETTSTSGRLGLAVGGYIGYDLHERVKLHGEVLFSVKGSYVNGVAGEQVFYTLSYIDVPLLAHVPVPIRGRVKPFVTVGPIVSFLLDAELENDEGTRDIGYVLKSTDLGVVFGAGADIELAPNHLLGAEVRYNLGLADIYDFPEAERDAIHNRAVMFLVRYQTCIMCSTKPGPKAQGPSDAGETEQRQEDMDTDAAGASELEQAPEGSEASEAQPVAPDGDVQDRELDDEAREENSVLGEP